MRTIQSLKDVRGLVRRLTDDLTDDQLQAQPDGFANNILWNMGHLVVTQQLLHYGRAGLDLHVPEDVVANFRKGTAPSDWEDMPDVEPIRHWLIQLPDQLATDYTLGRFNSYQAYHTSTGIVLRDIEDALGFNLFHEGLHVAAIARLKRALA